MAEPAYPTRGLMVWDDDLKVYIDGQTGATSGSVADVINTPGPARTAVSDLATASAVTVVNSLLAPAKAESAARAFAFNTIIGD